MSLFVRLETGFWTHRKTLRLKARLGDAALWIVPRLWCYAAEHQPDGDFSDYLPEEIAMLVGYESNAQAMLQALQDCGFMDEMKVHGWEERNSYHQAFSDRAKKAADARWGKHNEKKRNREEKRQALPKQSVSNAPSIKARGTIEEIKAFALEIGLSEADGEFCFFKWESNNWTNGKGPVLDWKMTMRSWKAASYMPSQKNGSSGARPKPAAKMFLSE